MRVRYVPVSEKQWIAHIQKGGFLGTPYQRGAGLGSIFRSLFRAILPVAKSAGRAIGKRALQAGADVATDLVAGKDFKDTLKSRGKEATGDLLGDASKRLKGGKLGKRTIKGRSKPVTPRRKQKKAVKTQLGILHY